jgi:hypothetical protein
VGTCVGMCLWCVCIHEQELGEEHPRKLIPELCRLFYNLGWVTGTGGGISIKEGYKVLSCTRVTVVMIA